MATFMKVTKRMNSNILGVVTGADFTNEKYPKSYLGFAEVGKMFFGLLPKVDRSKLMIYGVGFDDYIFGKENVEKATMLEEKAVLTVGNQKRFGPKYKINFKDGKTAIVTVASADSYKLEPIIY